MHLAVFSNNVAADLIKSGRVMDLLVALCLPSVHFVHSCIRGRCPMCDKRLAVYINGEDEPLPIGWSCESACHRKWHPSVLGLTHAALSAADNREVPVEEAVLFLRDFLAVAHDFRPGK